LREKTQLPETHLQRKGRIKLRKKDTQRFAGISGFYSALPSPFREDGGPELGALDALIESLLEKGVEGLCVGGMTGEYPILDIQDRMQVFKHVAERTAGRVPLIFGVGAECSGQILKMGTLAKDLGAVALLLPPPSFSNFSPQDLQEIMKDVAARLPLPVILYYIPQFTNAFGVVNVLSLFCSVENIVGVKDSSGDRKALDQFAAAKRAAGLCLMAGNDSLLLYALEQQANGCISGLSCMAPELMLGIYHAFQAGDKQRVLALQALVHELVAAVNKLPVPWGIKIALEVQGFSMGPLSWPCRSRMAKRVAAFRQWYEDWAPKVRELLSEPANFRRNDCAYEQA
jgi:dihydrodipicolinate synthase/N-acetylneuraminate lyase